jgi:hypothetical protein
MVHVLFYFLSFGRDPSGRTNFVRGQVGFFMMIGPFIFGFYL